MANQELVDAFDEFSADPELWVAIITGAGDKAFCAGNDLKYHAEIQAKTGKRPVHPAKGFGGLANRFDLDKPVIAAVNGVAMGGGFEIALACDIIVASDKATFALPEPRVGLAAGAGGMQRLSRMIPLKKAMGMMLTGRHVPAKEGYELGFVTEVVPHAELMTAARRWASDILACSPMSVRATKQVVMRSLDVPALEMAMHNQHYPGLRRHDQERGHGRRPQGLRREAQAQLEGPLRVFPTSQLDTLSRRAGFPVRPPSPCRGLRSRAAPGRGVGHGMTSFKVALKRLPDRMGIGGTDDNRIYGRNIRPDRILCQAFRFNVASRSSAALRSAVSRPSMNLLSSGCKKCAGFLGPSARHRQSGEIDGGSQFP